MLELNQFARMAASMALRSIPTAILLALLGLAALSPVRGDVTINRVDYHGWKGAYEMTNGTVDLVFVPQIGRVMRYGFIGKPNVLWENPELLGKTVDLKIPPKDWTNFGGDKLWPAPQDRSGWPPDVELDAGPQTVEILKNHSLRVIGTPSRRYHVRFVREISMAGSGTEVTFVNRMKGSGGEPELWSIWEVTQVDDPLGIEMQASSRYPGGYRPWPDGQPEPGTVINRGKKIWFTRSKTKGGKIGGSEDVEPLTAYVKGGRFSVWSEVPDEKVAMMPDESCVQQLWSNPDPLKYMELELLSPIRHPGKNPNHRLVTHWKLEPTR